MQRGFLIDKVGSAQRIGWQMQQDHRVEDAAWPGVGAPQNTYAICYQDSAFWERV